MMLERTPLLIEARGQRRHAANRAVDVERSRSSKLHKHHPKKKKRKKKRKKKLRIKALRAGRKELPYSYSVITREMDAPPTAPSFGMTMAGPGSFGPVSVGGIMRHS